MQNHRTYKKMVWLAVGSFGFAFAMVPMYNIACEKIFGIKLDKTASTAPKAGAARVDERRTVQVYFDGTVNSKLPWTFTPNVMSMSVVPGKLYEASFSARNIGGDRTFALPSSIVMLLIPSLLSYRTSSIAFSLMLLPAWR